MIDITSRGPVGVAANPCEDNQSHRASRLLILNGVNFYNSIPAYDNVLPIPWRYFNPKTWVDHQPLSRFISKFALPKQRQKFSKTPFYTTYAAVYQGQISIIYELSYTTANKMSV